MLLRRAAVLVLCVVAACRSHGEAAPSALTDDFGATIVRGSAGHPARIVSLSPATTELLFAIGAGPRVVGRTTWDTYPAEARAVPDVGAGLRPNVEAVLARNRISWCCTRAPTIAPPTRSCARRAFP